MLLMMLGASTLSWAAGPFGFEYGMSKEQVTDLIGKRSLKPHPTVPNLYSAEKAPRPHPGFVLYMLVITPDKGLIKITAVSQDITTNTDGENVKVHFRDIQQALAKIYGDGEDKDLVKDGSKLSAPSDWMESLNKNERLFATVWYFKEPKNHIETVALEARAFKPKVGYLVLSYEFEGFTSYVESRSKQKDPGF